MKNCITRKQMQFSGLSEILGEYLFVNGYCEGGVTYPSEYMTIENMLTILKDDFSGLDKITESTFRLGLKTNNMEYIYFRSNSILNVLWDGIQYKFKLR